MVNALRLSGMPEAIGDQPQVERSRGWWFASDTNQDVLSVSSAPVTRAVAELHLLQRYSFLVIANLNPDQFGLVLETPSLHNL